MSATWIACLTPPGQAAIATLGLSGPLAWPAVRDLFRTRSGKPLPDSPPPGRFWLGRLGTDVADEVVLAVGQASSLLEEEASRMLALRGPTLEIHCHGGREVVRFLTDLFTARGLRPCSWEEFLRHSGTPAWQAEAAAALARAPTVRTASILLDQYHGALTAALRLMLAELESGQTATARLMLSSVLRYAGLGRHLTEPWRVVIAGAPNVGKSSLVNALAGYQRSIVSPTPGTTRDLVRTWLAIDGWPVELTDTAGLRGAASLEEQGIALARASAASADLCLWLVDASEAPVWPEAAREKVKLVINKIDLPAAWDLDAVPDALRVSAQTGAGLEGLCAAVGRWLVPEPPVPGTPVPFTPALCETLARAAELLAKADTSGARAILESLSR
jgi:tRNA modification GTPase